MKVLSLFDGLSCGQIALKELGVKVDKYYASEIDKHAISQTQLNFPQTIQIGDVRNIDGTLFKGVDLLIGGSPCQNLSFIGNRAGLSTKENIKITSLEQYLNLKNDGFEFEGQSYLFWEYVRVLKEVNPKYFLLENVKMSNEWKSIFDEVLGVNGILINSNKLSAQNRPRYYWSNFSIDQPYDLGIVSNDILDKDQEWRSVIPTFYKKWGNEMRINKGVNWVGNDKLNCLTTKLCHTNQYLFNLDYSKMRMLTIDEACRLQTIPKWYNRSGIANTHMAKMLGNGWTIEVIKHIFSFLPKNLLYK